MSDREQLREDVARFLVDRIAAARGTSVGKADGPLAFFLADSLLHAGLVGQPTASPITRIPLTIVSTLDGATTDGVLVGVLAADLDALEGAGVLPVDEPTKETRE